VDHRVVTRDGAFKCDLISDVCLNHFQPWMGVNDVVAVEHEVEYRHGMAKVE